MVVKFVVSNSSPHFLAPSSNFSFLLFFLWVKLSHVCICNVNAPQKLHGGESPDKIANMIDVVCG